MEKLAVAFMAIDAHKSPLEGDARRDGSGLMVDVSFTLAKGGRVSELIRRLEDVIRVEPGEEDHGDALRPE